MNKKEISEIKRLFTPDRCPLTRICGCYVDAEKNKKSLMKEAFLSISEEEMFKYFDIFKKTLSGTVGKNLLDMEFPLAQDHETSSPAESARKSLPASADQPGKRDPQRLAQSEAHAHHTLRRS